MGSTLASSFDVKFGRMCDLTTPAVIATIKKFMKQKCIALLWLGTPCQTWSRARRWDGGPRPLCEDHALYGREGLNAQDQQKVAVGNLLACITCDLCTFASELGIRWVVENPFTSRIWLIDEIALLQRQGAVLQAVDFCAYGVPWRRSTGLLSHAFDSLSNVLQCCTSRHGRCQYSGRKHIALAGKNANGMWLTRVAQPYPHKFCHAICGQLARTHNVGFGV